jgi:hypothetical protein
MSGRKAIYHAVFPIAEDADTPTPTATPVVDTGSFDVRGGASQDRDSNDVAAQRIRWERAWHTATSHLTLPSVSVALKDLVQGNEDALQKTWLRPGSGSVAEAVAFILRSAAPFTASKVHDGTRRLVDWYTQEVTGHFVEHQLPAIRKVNVELLDNGSSH